MSGKTVAELRPNTIYCGDCLQVLQSQIPNESIDLIYMDPPFGSGTDYEVVFKDGVEIRHFKDRWLGGKETYLKWLFPIVKECKNKLKENGTFYIHCDDHLNAHIRLLLESPDLFGEGRFLNEIIWKRTFSHGTSRAFGRVHDTIFAFTKSSDYTWTPQRQEYSEKYKDGFFKFADPDGRRFRLTILTGPGLRTGESGKPWKGVDPTSIGRHWAVPGYLRREMVPPPATVQDALDRLEQMGRVVWPEKAGGTPSFKQYMDDMEGSDLQDIWTDIPPIPAGSLDRQGYPTEKPPKLLERIITASCPKDGIVLDPVCGCGTTIVAAQGLGRQWVGIDISPTSCRLIAKRVGVVLNDIIGLPRSMVEVKEMVKLDPIEFQNWVCDLLHAVSTTHRGQKPRPDANIDGWILSTIPIQVKGSEGIGYGEVERFRTSLKKRGRTEGFIVAFSFSEKAYEEAVRAAREEGITIDLLEVTEKTIPARGGKPDVRTFLYSKLSKRSWGEAPESAGPPPPPPLMLPLKAHRHTRASRLTEHQEATGAVSSGPKLPDSESSEGG